MRANRSASRTSSRATRSASRTSPSAPRSASWRRARASDALQCALAGGDSTSERCLKRGLAS